MQSARFGARRRFQRPTEGVNRKVRPLSSGISRRQFELPIQVVHK